MVPEEGNDMRIDYAAVAPEGMKRMYELNRYVEHDAKVDPKLARLVQLRASQINGCAFCLHMHTLQLQEAGETQVRIDCLSAWEETTLYTDRERAALAWTEAVTLVGQTHVPDAVFETLRNHFDDREIVDLTLVISVINVWNRLAISFRSDPNDAPALVRQTRQQVSV
jgi:AhpD family alkylhydroperoxidase